jgi:arylsulfatase A-like enzyme
MAKPVLKLLLLGAIWGAGVGLGFFALESYWVWTGNAAGLNIDQSGPFAALFAAIRKLLPPVLLRVLVAYLLSGAVVGLVAAAIARAWSSATGWRHRAYWGLAVLALLAIRITSHVVARPALFDDLPRFRPVLEWAVARGEPWHAQLAAAVLAASALVPLIRRLRIRKMSLAPLGVASAMVLLVVLLTGARHPAPAEKARRVVIIGIDAFRPDRLEALGGKRAVAPTLEAFAKEATLFTHAYTPIAQTEPAWRSLITARWPPLTGVRYPLTAPQHEVPLPTFPSALSEAGIHTAFATDCSRFHHENERSGFEQRWQPPKGALNFALEKLRYRAIGLFGDNAFGAWFLPEFVDNRALAGIHDPYGYAERLSQRMIEALQSGRSLFAFHSTAAHFPGDPSYPHYRKFVDPQRPLDRRLRMQFAPIGAGETTRDGKAWTPTDAEALYDELLAQSDAQVGTLFDALKAAGMWEDTTVIIFSDHGESFHADLPQLWGSTPVHGARLSEEENRILLMVKPAGGRKVERIDALVRLIDIGPTALESFGERPLPGADGESFWPMLMGEAQPPRILFAETGYTHASPAAFDAGHLARAPRTFEAYAVYLDGRVEMSDRAHPAVIAEKDFGAFDGEHWLVQSPRADGTVAEHCDGNCDTLRSWMQKVLLETP